jgi:hypothetical protein
MNKEIKPTYVSFEQAKWLKEIRFDVITNKLYHYNGSDFITLINKNSENFGFSAPEQWQVCEWLLQNHRLDIIIKYPESKTNKIEGINSVYYDLEIYKLQGGDAHKLYKFIGISDKKQKAYSVAFDYIKNNNLI